MCMCACIVYSFTDSELLCVVSLSLYGETWIVDDAIEKFKRMNIQIRNIHKRNLTQNLTFFICRRHCRHLNVFEMVTEKWFDDDKDDVKITIVLTMLQSLSFCCI